MKTFNKKALCAALAGLGVLGMAGSAQAVNLNPDGLGQVLIYPYYTVRASANGNAYNSLISVVNTTNVGKAVKVRFLEGKMSQEVLDFNLYMSPQDVWTGAIVPTPDGSGAMLFTKDTTCTAPPIPAGGEPFRNYEYAFHTPDAEDSSHDRTKEGYVELIEMADIPAGTPTFAAIKHPANGSAPPNCDAVQDDSSEAWPAWVASDLTAGTGKLFGSMTLINPNEAQDVAFEATALDAFFTPNPGSAPHLWYPTGSVDPGLSHVFPKTSVVVDGPDAYISSWTNVVYGDADPVSAVLMSNVVYNEYVLDEHTSSRTDWVITLPTKSYYYAAMDPATKIRPAQKLFQRGFGVGGACDDLSVEYYDREERTSRRQGDFSPMPPTKRNGLCWEANVVTFGNSTATSSLLNAENRVTLPVEFENGWARFTFAPPANANYHRLVSGSTEYVNLRDPNPQAVTLDSVTYYGLPMIGFAVQQFNNGEVPGVSGRVWASYAGRIAHRFSKKVTVTP